MPATQTLQKCIDDTFKEMIAKYKKAPDDYKAAPTLVVSDYVPASGNVYMVDEGNATIYVGQVDEPYVTVTTGSTAHLYVGAGYEALGYVTDEPLTLPTPFVEPKTQPPLHFDEACDLLDKAVDEYGADHIDAGTVLDRHVYFDGTKPECLIGVVLAYRGVGPEIGQGAITNMSSRLPFDMDTKTMWLLHFAQHANDTGQPWGKAVAWAKEATIDQTMKKGIYA